jgi:hypothetical protein
MMKYNERLIKCELCPTAYHEGDSCVAAGTLKTTKTDMICPKHYEPPSKGATGTTPVFLFILKRDSITRWIGLLLT